VQYKLIFDGYFSQIKFAKFETRGKLLKKKLRLFFAVPISFPIFAGEFDRKEMNTYTPVISSSSSRFSGENRVFRYGSWKRGAIFSESFIFIIISGFGWVCLRRTETRPFCWPGFTARMNRPVFQAGYDPHLLLQRRRVFPELSGLLLIFHLISLI
jgi:hypothetical protein